MGTDFRWRGRLPAVLFAILLPTALSPAAEATRISAGKRLQNGLEVPLSFEENRGQAPESVSFYSNRQGRQTLMMSDRIALRLAPAAGWRAGEAGPAGATTVSLRFPGMSALAKPVAEGLLPTRSSYFLGSNPEKWKTGIRHFRRVRYTGIYPGIDLLLYGNGLDLEFDLVVTPGADPSQVRLLFEGADRVELNRAGEIVLSTPAGKIVQKAPKIYQESDGGRRNISGTVVLLEDGSARFQIDSYDRSLPLTIDPVLVYSTYVGGTRGDIVQGVAVDDEGNAYISGSTGSLDFPLANPLQDEFAGGGATIGDIFVSKIDPSGSFFVYSTYLGGSGTEVGRGLALDDQGQVYVTGTTFSPNFPSTPGSYQPVCAGQCPFLFKLSADGSQLVYSTFLGRGDGSAVAVDSNRQAVITGKTTDANFPIRNAHQAQRGGQSDAFAAKFNSAGTDLIFSTFLGGTGDDNLDPEDGGIAVDPAGNIYISGTTNSNDFPTANPIQAQKGGDEDAFLVKLTAQGAGVYSTYFGGSADDSGQGVAADADGNAFWIGSTVSDDLPVTDNAFQPDYGGGVGIGDAFVVRVPAAGGSREFATYFGGPGGDIGEAIALDGEGRIVLGGRAAAGFPTVDPFRPFNGNDAYVSKMSPDGSSLVYSIALGGGNGETALALATRGTAVFAGGSTVSPDFPILGALQPRSGGDSEGFLTQIGDSGNLYFAQFGNGTAGANSAISEILLTNSSFESDSTATVELRDDNGDPLAVNLIVSTNGAGAVAQGLNSMLEVTVPPLGLVKVSTDGTGPLQIGSASVSFDNPLGGVIRFNLTPFGTAGVGDSRLVRGFITPVRQGAIDTGVALFNPQDSQIGIRMRLRDSAGQEITGGLRTRALPARGHLAEFIDQSFPNADLDNFEGTLTVEVTSLNALITATALELGGQPGQFTTLPVTPLP